MTKNHSHRPIVTELPAYLSDAQVAALFDIHPATPRQWRYQKRGPAYVKLSNGLVRYERETLLAYLAARTIDNEPSDPSATSASHQDVAKESK